MNTTNPKQHTVWIGWSSVTIICAVVGNILSVVVLTNKRSRRSSFNVYLTTLAIADMLGVYPLMITLMNRTIGFDVASYNIVACKVYFFCAYAFPQLSSWIIVLLTLERAFCVCFPLHVKLWCTPKTAAICLSVCIIILFLMDSHILLFAGIRLEGNATMCLTTDENYLDFIDFYWCWIDFALYYGFPVLFIVTGNIVIIYKIAVTRKSEVLPGRKNVASTRLFFMTLTISIAFILLTSPLFVYSIGAPYWFGDDYLRSMGELESYLDVICHQLFYTYHALNFFLYVCSGAEFRQHFKEIFFTVCLK